MYHICNSLQLSCMRFRPPVALPSLVQSQAAACCLARRKGWRIGRAIHLATQVVLPTSQDAVLAEDSRAKEPFCPETEAAHAPVLLKEVVAHFESRRLTSFVDCTLGAGGHAAAVISAHPEMEVFLGMDVDPVAHTEAYSRLQRATACHACSGSSSELNLLVKRTNFRNIKNVIEDLDPTLKPGGVDGILMDLGMSSMQVNEADRGFSFMRDGPADMRMDPTAFLTAEVILNTWPEAEVGRILRDYGEERRWKYLAERIVAERLSGGISTTSQLVKIIGGRSFIRTKAKFGKLKRALHPATRTFQALRIAVNDELNSLDLALSDAFDCLSTGGRLQVITFHSLEDKIVKHFFLNAAGLQRSNSVENKDNPSLTQEYAHFPGETRYSKYMRKKALDNESGENINRSKNVVEGPCAKILSKRPIVPGDEERNLNPRSRSAKLRVIEKK